MQKRLKEKKMKFDGKTRLNGRKTSFNEANNFQI